MKLFRKKEKIILRSEQMKDEFIDKPENAQLDYDIRTDRDESFDGHPTYIIRVYATDLAKVV